MLAIIVIAMLLFLMAVISFTSNKEPQISVIDPISGNPGDVLTIYGSNFGSEMKDGYVEIGGFRLTASSFLNWSDSSISLKLPENMRDGLVYVVTKAGKSEPKIFTNKTSIPVPVIPDLKTSVPIIYGIDEKSQSVGSLITINGKNFGLMRNDSSVSFSWKEVDKQNNEFILCENVDYEYWSDECIRVRVPDGATTGSVVVKTEKGASNNFPFTIDTAIGSKLFDEKRTYIIDSCVEISNLKLDDNTTGASMVIRFPLPPTSPSQRSVDVTESNPEPSIANLSGTLVHEFDISANENIDSFSVKHSFVVTNYAIKTSIKESSVKPYSTTCTQLMSSYLKSDEIIFSDDEKIIKLAKEIVGTVKNPYTKAKLIYNYMISNFKIKDNLRSDNSSPLDLLNWKTGDAYDFAIVYCSLLRAAAVPAIPVAGVLVDSSMKAKPHWWCEFYVEKVGWVPVDVALGSGLEYESFKQLENPDRFYFGNLDGQHIIFSRGVNHLRSSMSYSKIVYQPKSYALQSIWEESSNQLKSYSSYWINPNIVGIY